MSTTTNRASALADQLTALESLSGDGTELVSIAHPPGKTLTALRQRVEREHAHAEQIKDKTTRRRVQRALNRIAACLNTYHETPDTGLAIYAGVVNGEMQTIVIDDDTLPAPLQESQYTCADHFDTTPVREILKPDTTYGLIVVERGHAIVGQTHGEQTIPIHSLESQVMGKTRAGGQSAPRFERERARQTNEFFQTIATVAEDAFLDNTTPTVQGILIGGTLATAKQFATGDYLHHQLANRVLGVYSVEYATERGLTQLRNAGSDAVDTDRHADARDTLDEFYTRLATDGPVAYGYEHVMTAAEYGAVDTLLLSPGVPDNKHTTLTEVVESHGGDLVRVPRAIERGEAFANTFDGVAALLRFPVN